MKPSRRPRAWAAGLTLVVVTLVALLAVLGGASKSGGQGRNDRLRINLATRSFVPPGELDLRGIRAERRSDASRRVHFLLQFDDTPTGAGRERLEKRGISIDGYVSGNAYRASSRAEDLEALASIPAVRAAFPLRPSDKLSPELAPSRIGPHARRGRRVLASIHLHPDVRLGPAARLIRRAGARPYARNPFLPGISVVATRAALHRLARDGAVKWVAPIEPRLRPLNDSARITSGVRDVVSDRAKSGIALTGAGITGLIFDAGTVADHVDFGNRVIEREKVLDPQSHATHVAGIFAGAGSNSGGKYAGMAPQAKIRSLAYSKGPFAGKGLYDAPGDLAHDAVAAMTSTTGANGIDLMNMSLGAPKDCSLLGDYTETAGVVDDIVTGKAAFNVTGTDTGVPLLFTQAAGNERVGDFADPSNAAKDIGPCGAYGTIISPAPAKNSLVVGSINANPDLFSPPAGEEGLPHTGENRVALDSSWGPTKDFRLKPDIVAPGCNREPRPPFNRLGIWSTTSVPKDGYESMCGTSMAAPTAAGVAALLMQQYRDAGKPLPLPHTVKALFVHSAVDLGRPGQDYQNGWGAIDARAALDLARKAERDQGLVVGEVDKSTNETAFYAKNDDDIRVTLAWDDPKADPARGYPDPQLVNDLDLVLVKPDKQTLVRPKVLPANVPPTQLERLPVDGVDDRNNVEQVRTKGEPGIWKIRVVGTNVKVGPQKYTLIGPSQRSLSLAPKAVQEGNTGSHTTSVAVTLSAPSTQPVNVAYTLSSGSPPATPGTDYAAEASGELTFEPGETIRRIDVDIKGDEEREPDEVVAVQLGAIQGEAWPKRGRAAVTIVDDDTPHDFDVVAKTGDLGLEEIEFGPSINNRGRVAFQGRALTPAGVSKEALFVGGGATDQLRNITPNTHPNRLFQGAPQINDLDKVVSQTKVNTLYQIREWNADLTDSAFTIAAMNEFDPGGAQFDAVVGFPTTTHAGRVAFGAFKSNQHYVAAPGAGDSFYQHAVNGRGILRPMAADGREPGKGYVVLRMGDKPTDPIKLLSDRLAYLTTIADVDSGFAAVGRAPGISDEGQIITFYGDLTEQGAARLGLAPGPGVFASVATAEGRRIVRIAGVAGNGHLDPGETHEDADGDAIVDPGEDVGVFTGFSADTRVAVNSTQDEQQAVTVVYLARDASNRTGLYRSRLKFLPGDGEFDVERPGSFAVREPVLVARQGMTVKGLSAEIAEIVIHDPVNDHLGGDVAFQVTLANGTHAVLRSRAHPNPVIFIPGAAGSRLEDQATGEDIWEGPFTFNPLDFEAERDAWLRGRLSLSPADGAGSRDVRAKDALRYMWDLPLHWKLDIYGSFLTELEERGGYRPFQPEDRFAEGCNEAAYDGSDTTRPREPDLFVFPYDWRKGMEESAAQLEQYVACVRRFYPHADVDVIAHSMGGLIARRYIMENPGTNAVDSLITVGAPWLGAPRVSYVMESGDFVEHVARGPGVRHAVRTMPGVKQLGPSSDYLRLSGTRPIGEFGRAFADDRLIPLTPADVPTFFDYPTMVQRLDQRHAGTGSAIDAFHSTAGPAGDEQDDWSQESSDVSYHHIYALRERDDTVGRVVTTTEQKCASPTPERLVCDEDNLLKLGFTAGDQTVPEVSASRVSDRGNLNAPTAQLHPIVARKGDDDRGFQHTYMLSQNDAIQDLVLELLGREDDGAAALAVQDEPAPERTGSLPSHYLTISGAKQSTVADAHGNTTARIPDAHVPGSVPGVSTYWLGDDAELVLTPVDEAYTVTFAAAGGPLRVESVTGTEHETTRATRYLDVDLRPGTQVQVHSSGGGGFDELRTDGDGDGSFETTIEPTVSVAGTDARDDQPPVVSLRQDENGMRLVAHDGGGTGVARIVWSTDGEVFEPYAGSMEVDPRLHPFVYAWAEDVAGNRSTTVRLRVRLSNQTPIPHDDLIVTDEDQALAFELRAGDGDGDALIYEVVDGPTRGSLTGHPPELTYTPDADVSGEDVVRFRASDGASESRVGELRIRVRPVNDAPSPRDGQLAATEDGSPVSLDLAALVADRETADADLEYAVVEQPAKGSLVAAGLRFAYTPASDANGEDSFTYTVTDRGDPDACGEPFDGAPLVRTDACDVPRTSEVRRVTIDVAPVDDAPRALSRTVTGDEDQPVSVRLEAEDPDRDGLSFQLEQAPAHGGLSGTAPDLVYTPQRDFTGEDVLRFRAADDNTDSDIGEIRIRVRPVNDVPDARDGSVAALEDGGEAPVDLAGLVADHETADAQLVYEIVRPPVKGTLSGAGASRGYTPHADAGGADSFAYRVTDRGDPDGCGASVQRTDTCDLPRTSATRTLTIAIAESNDAPLTVEDAAALDEDGLVVVDVAANDAAGPGAEAGQTLAVRGVEAPTHGHAEAVASGAERGRVRYRPEADFNGADAVRYTVCDDGRTGGLLDPKCATGVLRLEVRPVNDVPRTEPDSARTLEDEPVDLDPTANDAAGPADESSDSMRVDRIGDPARGSAEVLPDGRIRYRPDTDVSGIDVIAYRVCDGGGACADDTVTVSVAAVNDAPRTVDDATATDEDEAVTVDVLANDRPGPVDEGAQRLDVRSAGAPAHGRTEIVTDGLAAGTVRYRPEQGFAGDDAFEYTACDDGESDGASAPRCATGRVTVTIAGRNHAPQVELRGATPLHEGGQPVTLTADGDDADGDPLTYAWSADGGELTAEGRSATLRADDGPADIRVRVTASDGQGGTAADEAVVHVHGVAPSASAGADISGHWGLPLHFATRNVDDPSAADRAAGFLASWTFGDVPTRATGTDVTHAYAEPGSYLARLLVLDKDGQAAQDEMEVRVFRRESALAYIGATSLEFLPQQISARLTDAVHEGSAQLAGHLVVFGLGDREVSARTDDRGLATVRLDQPPPAGPSTLSLRFDGDRFYAPASQSVPLTVGNASLGRVVAAGLKLRGGAQGVVQAATRADGVDGILEFKQPSLRSRELSALGIDAAYSSAWVAGLLTTGEPFLVYLEEGGPQDPGVFRLWIDGRALPGSGRLIAGNVDIRPGPHASITGERTQAAALTLPKGCVKSGAASRVTGPRIRSVTWLVDGRKHAIVRRAVRRQTFTFRLPVRELGSGRHRLMAVVRQVSGRRQIIRRAFRVCA